MAEDGFWHHDIEVVPAVRSTGNYEPSPMLDLMQLPARLDGVRVLADAVLPAGGDAAVYHPGGIARDAAVTCRP
jgi:hypothetical protein